MKQFEYRFDHHEFPNDAEIEGVNSREVWLNSLGAEGWQLVSINLGLNVDYTCTYAHVVLMREKA